MEEFPVAARLKKIISSLGLSDSQFADQCKISRPTLSLFLSGKNKKISDILLTQIHTTFPNVSILWLLFGEGEMFKADKEVKETDNLFAEDSLFPEGSIEDDEKLNLVNLNHLENIVKDVVNKAFNNSKNDIENLVLKISQPNNLRKANKITVYYDDSTFETFIPEHN